MTVPILGQPGVPLTWYPTALIHCKCIPLPAITILITTGIHNHTKCGNCGVEYWIDGINPDGTVRIDFMIPTLKGQVM